MELSFYMEWHVGESAVIFLGVLGNEAAFAAERRKETAATTSWSLEVPDEFDVSAEDGLEGG